MTGNRQTARLTLKIMTEGDFEKMHFLLSFAEVDQYNTLGIPANLAETKILLEPLIAAGKLGEKYTFCIFETATNTFVGAAGVTLNRPKYKSAEIWFKYMPTAWGKGFATETVNELLQFCFKNLGLHRVEAGCAVDNVASKRVMEKAGMSLEGRKRQNLPLKSGWSDNYEFAILDTDLV